MSPQRRLLAAFTVAAALVAPPGAADEASTGVSSLDVRVGGQQITVAGKAVFRGEPVQVATDARADARLPSGDLTAGSIHAVDQRTLHFMLTLADPLPTGAGTPELLHYNWNFYSTVGDQSTEYYVQALRTATAQTLDPLKPFFALRTCEENAGGGRTCSRGDLTGEFGTSTITIHLPTSLIGATRGAVLTDVPDRSVNASEGVSAVRWYNPSPLADVMVADDFVVPEPTVELAVVPAAAQVQTWTATANVTPSGAFTGHLALPNEPGDYVVVARACFGHGNCGTSSVPLVV